MLRLSISAAVLLALVSALAPVDVRAADVMPAKASPGTGNDAGGMPIPPFLPQTLTATISDDTAAMFVARYTSGPLKLYAGYEHIQYAAPSDLQSAFTDIGGAFVCEGCTAFGQEHPQCAGTFDAVAAAIDWRFAPKGDVYFGAMFSQVNGGFANGFIKRSNFDPTVGVRFRF
jgi:hypothetical protein